VAADRRCNCDDCRRRYVQPVRELGTLDVGSIFNSVAWHAHPAHLNRGVVTPAESPLAIGETRDSAPGLGRAGLSILVVDTLHP